MKHILYKDPVVITLNSKVVQNLSSCKVFNYIEHAYLYSISYKPIFICINFHTSKLQLIKNLHHRTSLFQFTVTCFSP